jgi:hypothetical protein
MRRWFVFVMLCSSALATDTYFAQGSAGGNNGTNCANAFAATSGSWASSFGPGNTQHLCAVNGNITTALTAGGSGSSGNPDTIFFEAGAKLIMTICPSSGCLNVANQSYIILDGGTGCGYISQANVSCNGQVGSSASGTAFGNGGTSSFGIEATNCQNCEIRNLNIGPIYVHTSTSDAPSADFRGVDQLGLAASGTTFKVHNNEVHDASSLLVYVPDTSNDVGMYTYNNYLHDMNSGQDLSNNNNGTVNFATVHDNHFFRTATWDVSPCGGQHHNSLHAFANVTANNHINYYNNLVDGNSGGCQTSELFLDGTYTPGAVDPVVFNNLFLATYTQMNNGIVSITAGGTLKYYNNTALGQLQSGDQCLSLNLTAGATASVYNNINASCNQLFESSNSAASFSVFDYNTWGGQPSGSPWAYSCGGSGCTYASTLAAWRSACSCDANSTFGAATTYVKVNSTGTLQAGSPAISAGLNLTSFSIAGLDSDITGAARPGGSTAWDDGAFNFAAITSSPTQIGIIIP